MNFFNTLLLLASLLLVSSVSFAKNNPATFRGNINTGHFYVSGSSGLGLSHTNYDGGSSSTQFDLATTTAYFVDYGFAVGGTVDFLSHDSLDRLSIGPTVVYYLVADDRIGVPLTGSVLLQHHNRSRRTNTNVALQAGIGFQYFITSALAVGPTLQFRQVVGDTEGGLETRTLGVVANFSLFL
jgi:hypothetical protein